MAPPSSKPDDDGVRSLDSGDIDDAFLEDEVGGNDEPLDESDWKEIDAWVEDESMGVVAATSSGSGCSPNAREPEAKTEAAADETPSILSSVATATAPSPRSPAGSPEKEAKADTAVETKTLASPASTEPAVSHKQQQSLDQEHAFAEETQPPATQPEAEPSKTTTQYAQPIKKSDQVKEPAEQGRSSDTTAASSQTPVAVPADLYTAPKPDTFTADSRASTATQSAVASSGSPESEISPQPQEEPKDPAQSTAAWGWGATWGLGALSGKLKEVAAGTVRELTGSLIELQQALAEVDEDDEALETSSLDGRPSSSSRSEAVNTRKAKSEGGAPGAADGRQEAPVAQEITRQPEQARAGKEEEDEELEVGLKAIDEQVEQLATGAAKALTSIGGLLSGVAKGGWTVGQNIASKVEATTKVLVKDLSAGVSEDVQQLQEAATSSFRGAAGKVTKLGSRLERGLETVSRTALGLLEEVANQYVGRPQDASNQGPSEPASFDDFFHLYGGQQLCDEVQDLSNECARVCNKSRARLEAAQQQQLDTTMAQLGEIFSVNLEDQAQKARTEPERKSSEGGEGAEDASCWQQLQQRYTPITYLCTDSQSKAQVMGADLAQAAEQAAKEEAARKAEEQAPSKQESAEAPGSVKDEKQAEDAPKVREDQPSASAIAADGVQAAASSQDAAAQEAAPVAAEAADPAVVASPVLSVITTARAQSAKRLAELCTAQVGLLLNYGNSLAAPAHSAKPVSDGLAWPAAAQEQASLLRSQAQRMVGDVLAVTQAYCKGLEVLSSAPAADHLSSLPGAAAAAVREAAEGLARELKAAGSSAVVRVHESYRGLLYSILVRTLVTQVAQ
mmetsp:Transcript_24482/g.53488  ORF Transcript_24482/g.53488 Transcript_24482/m.53488 type:complete len:850 (-) Transcript_24482:513-3062(-)